MDRGGLILFVVRSLLPFVQGALHPGLGPAGQVQVLIPGAFISVALTMLALGMLFAGAGAVIGRACGQVLLVPLVILSRHLVARGKRSRLEHPTSSARASLSRLSVGGLVVSIVILSAAGAGSLLTYGTTTNLYQSVPVQGKHTSAGGESAPTTGTLQSGTFTSPALGGVERTYWIYLPPSYAVSPTRRYPTFYLLHEALADPVTGFRQRTRPLQQMH